MRDTKVSSHEITRRISPGQLDRLQEVRRAMAPSEKTASGDMAALVREIQSWSSLRQKATRLLESDKD